MFCISIYAKQFILWLCANTSFTYLCLPFDQSAGICKSLTLENNMFTNNQYWEMVILCGASNRNKGEAAMLNAMKFPDQNQSHSNTIAKIIKRLTETGSFKKHPRLSRFTNSTVPPDDILGYTLAHLEFSVQYIIRECIYSKGMESFKLWCIFTSDSDRTRISIKRQTAPF